MIADDEYRLIGDANECPWTSAVVCRFPVPLSGSWSGRHRAAGTTWRAKHDGRCLSHLLVANACPTDFEHSPGGDTRPVPCPPLLVHGDACGADRIAEGVWHSWGLPTEAHPPDWDAHGKAAGLLRNQAMVTVGAAVCVAFIANHSHGATRCAGLAEHAGIPTWRSGSGFSELMQDRGREPQSRQSVLSYPLMELQESVFSAMYWIPVSSVLIGYQVAGELRGMVPSQYRMLLYVILLLSRLNT